MSTNSIKTEEFKMHGETLVSRLKELFHEGNIRRITIKNEDDHTLIEIPLTVGVVGALLLPVWAVVGAIAALAANLTIIVEHNEEHPVKKTDSPSANTSSSV
jgi:DNA-binding Lrp family transcriptional regulator